jgi:hypothetical protein
MKLFGVLAAILTLAMAASAETCPRVSYTTTASTLRSLVAAVNCLNARTQSEETPVSVRSAAAEPVPSKGGMEVDSVKIVGPQHSRPYAQVVMAVLTVPTGGTTKTAVVTPDARQATVTAEAGGSCSVTINPDKTVDSHCYLAGGTVYILYH